MKKILIADCGGTSCSWMAVVGAGGGHVFSTPGFNAAVTDEGAMAASVSECAATLASVGFRPDEIHFYGAGCGTPVACGRVSALLERHFPGIRPEVESDLVEAARATIGDSDGIAGILGTGANAGLFIGGKPAGRIPPMGYILGDEGSGAYLGKKLLVKMLRGEFDAGITALFREETGIDEAVAIERVYRTPGANAFLGSLTRFISAHIGHPGMEALVTEAMKNFRQVFVEPHIQTVLCAGGESAQLKIGVVGSIGHVFRTQLERVFSDLTLYIVKDPLEGVARYHISRQ